MREVYRDARDFVSCEQVTSLPALLNVIADVLQIPPAEYGPSLQKHVLQHLRQSPTLFCLDNFEDPWDALGRRRHIEEFLDHLDALPDLGLIMTTRVSERLPRISWTDSHSDALSPLHISDAVALFERISSYQDLRIANLVSSVECVPLAIAKLLREDNDPSELPHIHSTSRELSNAESMILKGLPLWDGKPQIEDVLQAANVLAGWQRYVVLPNLEVLHTALRYATTPRSQAMCHYNLGIMSYSLRDNNEGERYLYKAIPLFHDISDVYMEGECGKALGNVHTDNGRFSEAESDLKTAIVLLHQVGRLEGEGDVLRTVGIVFMRDGSGRYRDAEALLKHALAIHAQLGNTFGNGQAQRFLGDLYLECSRLGCRVTFLACEGHEQLLRGSL